jgi:hypothetical protein
MQASRTTPLFLAVKSGTQRMSRARSRSQTTWIAEKTPSALFGPELPAPRAASAL